MWHLYIQFFVQIFGPCGVAIAFAPLVIVTAFAAAIWEWLERQK